VRRAVLEGNRWRPRSTSRYTRVDGSLLVLSKRNKQRRTYVKGGAAIALKQWSAVRRSHLDELFAEVGPLFVPISKGGRRLPRP
jgi:site-specific recombinase XerC